MAITYKNLLEQMRAEVSASVEAPVIKSNNFVPNRPAPALPPQESEEYDPVKLLTEWMRVIKTSGQKVRESALKQKEASPVVETVVAPSTVKRPPEVAPSEDPSMFDGGDDPFASNRSHRRGGGKDLSSARTFTDLIDITEGGGSYKTLFNHAQNNKFSGTDITKMTIGQLKEFTSPSGAYGQHVKNEIGRVATPMGRYQIVGSTLRSVASAMGLSDDTLFDEKTQDAMGNYLYRQALEKGTTTQEKISNLRNTWEGFKSVPTAKLASIIRQV